MAILSEEQKRTRRYAVQSAVGTHVLEDLAPDAETRAILLRYEKGELTLNQFSDAMDKYAQNLAQSRLPVSA